MMCICLFHMRSIPLLPNSSMNSTVSVGKGVKLFLRREIVCVFKPSVCVGGRYILKVRFLVSE